MTTQQVQIFTSADGQAELEVAGSAKRRCVSYSVRERSVTASSRSVALGYQRAQAASVAGLYAKSEASRRTRYRV